MPDILTIFKENIEFLTPQEQLDEINHLIYALNNTHFNFMLSIEKMKYYIN